MIDDFFKKLISFLSFYQILYFLKVSIMFIVVLIVFGVCWLPYHTYFIYNYYSDIASQSYSQHVFLAFFWLAMANSAVNPIIYFMMNAK